MAHLNGVRFEASLGSDDIPVTVGGQAHDFASWRLGELSGAILLLGGTGNRKSDLQRLHSLFARSLEAVTNAIGDDQR